jgi:hypothetical protein
MNDIASPYDWGDPIEVPRKVPRLIRVPAEKPIKGVLISDRLWKLLLHYNGKRCRPCTMKSGACDLCNIRPLRAYYLLCVHQTFEDSTVWIQVTPDALLPVQRQYVNFADLFGHEIEIGRIRKSKAAPIYMAVQQYTAVRKVKHPADPTETLRRVFYGEATASDDVPLA